MTASPMLHAIDLTSALSQKVYGNLAQGSGSYSIEASAPIPTRQLHRRPPQLIHPGHDLPKAAQPRPR